MEPFELVFAMFGLLLGLAIAEVLGGFARVLKLKRSAREQVRIGWLTPLLGLFVILDLTSFWLVAWDGRDQIAPNYPTLVAVLAIVGVYYLAANLICPDEPQEWPDFDDWYDQHNRMVIGGLLGANLLSGVGQFVLEMISPVAEEASDIGSDVAALGELLILVAIVALLIVKGRRWNVALLATAIALLLANGVVEAVL